MDEHTNPPASAPVVPDYMEPLVGWRMWQVRPQHTWIVDEENALLTQPSVTKARLVSRGIPWEPYKARTDE